MSYKEDERVTDEIEALEAILMDDVRIVRTERGRVHMIETLVHPSTGEDAEQQYVCVSLEVTLTEKYPDQSPLVTLRNPRGLDDDILTRIHKEIDDKLEDCLGQPIVFELIELIKEKLTESNQPSGTCAICLYGFATGDAFIKTQCYHHFHSHCLAGHLLAGEKNYKEELDKLPQWQRLQAPPYQPSCPVCRALVSCDVETLRRAPPPHDSVAAPPFRLTAELKALQREMAALLAVQTAKGGTVGGGDVGPRPLTITEPDSADNGSTNSSPSGSQDGATSKESNGNGSKQNGQPPEQQPVYKGPFRGFNRRGNFGRRGNGRGRFGAGNSQPSPSAPR